MGWIDDIMSISEDVRYVAIYENGILETKSRADNLDASDDESDKYEELLVNPTILKIAQQRGDIDCGGLEYVLIKYGNFYQLIRSIARGHVSICIHEKSDPIELQVRINMIIEKWTK